MDLVSFRELYGFMSGERLEEIEELQKAAGAHDVSRENAEAELFGKARRRRRGGARGARAPRHIEATTTPGVSAVTPDLGESLGGKLQREEARSRVYPPGETEQGVVLNAAVILKDPKLIPQTIKAIEAPGTKAGLPLKAISWQKASGIIGQFVKSCAIVLYVAILIIFVIALVIINNALVMATLERVKEIGTLRAIGAQRRFILAMLVIESMVVGLIFGGLGAGVGGADRRDRRQDRHPGQVRHLVLLLLGAAAVSRSSGTSNVIVAFVTVLLVSAFSSFYPAWLAMRVTPAPGDGREEELIMSVQALRRSQHRAAQPDPAQPAHAVPGHRDRRGDRAARPAERPVDRHPRDDDRHRDHAHHRAPERRRLLQDHRRARRRRW